MAFALLGEEEEAYEELQKEVPNLIIKELERIKVEIIDKQEEFIHSDLLSECHVRYGLNIAEIIINKHISELKGEQE